jgi:hypothetical protein
MDTGAREKTLDEIKAEVLRRAEKRLSPFNHVRLEDAQRVVQSLASLDRDHWAEEWCRVGLPYEEQGDELARRGAGTREIGDAYYNAFELCRMAASWSATCRCREQPRSRRWSCTGAAWTAGRKTGSARAACCTATASPR